MSLCMEGALMSGRKQKAHCGDLPMSPSFGVQPFDDLDQVCHPSPYPALLQTYYHPVLPFLGVLALQQAPEIASRRMREHDMKGGRREESGEDIGDSSRWRPGASG